MTVQEFRMMQQTAPRLSLDVDSVKMKSCNAISHPVNVRQALHIIENIYVRNMTFTDDEIWTSSWRKINQI